MRKRTHIILAIAIGHGFLLQSCLGSGPSPFQQDGSSSSDYQMLSTEIDGGVSAGYDSSISATQVLAATGSSEINGASVSFPAGALAVDSLISLEEGSSLASSSTSQELGINSGLSSGGPAVVVSSSIAIDADQSFGMSLPRSSAPSLALGSDDDRIVVVYRVYRAREGQYYTGMIPKSELSIESAAVKFETKYFGAYQVVITDEVIKNAVEAKTEAPVLTKTDEKKLPDPVWKIQLPIVDNTKRNVTVQFTLKETDRIVSCAASIHDNRDRAPLEIRPINSPNEIDRVSGSGFMVIFNSLNDGAHSIFMKFSCLDISGRSIDSQWSKDAKLPAKTTNPNSTLPPPTPLTLTGFGKMSAGPDTRRINFDSDNLKTVSGTCNPNGGPIEIHWDSEATPSDSSTVCTSTGTFSFTINSYSHSGDVVLENKRRSYAFDLKQQAQFMRFVVYQIDSYESLNIITTSAQFLAMNNQSGVYALGNDVTLSADQSLSTFNGIFSGDLRKIKGVNISSNGTSPIGLIASINNGAFVGHVELDSPTINVSGLSYVGSLVGSAGSCSNSCTIVGVRVTNARINGSGIGSISKVGGIIGTAINTRILFSNFSGTIDITSTNSSHIGGIVGALETGSTVEATLSTATINGKTYLGGIAGVSAGSIRNSRSASTITTNAIGAQQVNVGGIVGSLITWGNISESSSSGTLHGSDSHTHFGGVAGYSQGSINRCASSVDIIGGTKIGGLVGEHAGGSIQESYARGTLNSGGDYCGGLIGYAAGGTGPTLNNSFSTSSVTCTGSHKAGLIGALTAAYNPGSTNVAFISLTNCTTGYFISGCLNSSTISDFDQPTDTYFSSANWNFTSYWLMEPNGPALRHVP